MDGAHQPERTIVAEAKTIVVEAKEQAARTRPPPIWSLQLVKAERLSILRRCAPGQPYYEQALHAYVEADQDLQKALLERFGLDTLF